MRCRILREGRSHKRWEYILEFDKSFDNKSFVRDFNDAVTRIKQYEDFLLDFQNSCYYLVNDSIGTETRYAEFTFTRCKSPKQAIICVKRLEMTRENLHEFLEIMIGNIFSQPQPKSQLSRCEQLSLFQPD